MTTNAVGRDTNKLFYRRTNDTVTSPNAAPPTNELIVLETTAFSTLLTTPAAVP